ncbi:MAG: MliC family protein [Alphaproteobacteria bacterium]|nr:MliC family protein [Alphaproteobacteria bacterium]MBQ8042095.1 MliC family protein [Alphaproteobacteria bacterium]MBQ8367999.1 MliC family protein [Alphaproteobacteria bacterium]
MSKFVSLIVLISMLGACKPHQKPIVCGDYSVVIKSNDDGTMLDATINEDATVLYLVVSASGAKYDGQLGDDKITLWNKGDAWTMFVNDGDAIVCE